MADTIYLNDGSVEVCCTDKGVFFERLIREKLGDDAADFFKGYCEALVDDALYEESEKSESENEKIADGYLALCHEATDNFRVLLDMLNAPRLNRKALIKAAQTGYDALYKNL